MVPAAAASMIVGLSTATTRKEAPAMAGADRMTIEEVVKQVMVREHGDVLRAAVEAVCAQLMDGEVSEQIGAELGERRPDDRMTHRNGYRPREWQTRAGTVELQIPKLRRGS
jgi:putative transposase